GAGPGGGHPVGAPGHGVRAVPSAGRTRRTARRGRGAGAPPGGAGGGGPGRPHRGGQRAGPGEHVLRVATRRPTSPRLLTYPGAATAAARRRTPSSISSSDTLLNASRTFSPPRPSGKKGTPGTTLTPSRMARRATGTDPTPSGSVNHEKKPPLGLVHAMRPARC